MGSSTKASSSDKSGSAGKQASVKNSVDSGATGVLGSIGSGPQFIKESWAELKKVSSPTRAETTQATIVVLTMIVIVSSFLALADLVFHTLMTSIAG